MAVFSRWASLSGAFLDRSTGTNLPSTTTHFGALLSFIFAFALSTAERFFFAQNYQYQEADTSCRKQQDTYQKEEEIDKGTHHHKPGMLRRARQSNGMHRRNRRKVPPRRCHMVRRSYLPRRLRRPLSHSRLGSALRRYLRLTDCV